MTPWIASTRGDVHSPRSRRRGPGKPPDRPGRAAAATRAATGSRKAAGAIIIAEAGAPWPAVTSDLSRHLSASATGGGSSGSSGAAAESSPAALPLPTGTARPDSEQRTSSAPSRSGGGAGAPRRMSAICDRCSFALHTAQSRRFAPGRLMGLDLLSRQNYQFDRSSWQIHISSSAAAGHLNTNPTALWQIASRRPAAGINPRSRPPAAPPYGTERWGSSERFASSFRAHHH